MAEADGRVNHSLIRDDRYTPTNPPGGLRFPTSVVNRRSLGILENGSGPFDRRYELRLTLTDTGHAHLCHECLMVQLQRSHESLPNLPLWQSPTAFLAAKSLPQIREINHDTEIKGNGKKFAPPSSGAHVAFQCDFQKQKEGRMLIRQTRVRSLKGKVARIKIGTDVVVGARLVPDLMPKLKRIGFPEDANVGDAVLPAGIGPVSRFNAHGMYIIHKDKPKETAYRTVEWHWKEFRGRYDTEDMSKLVDVPYERYPRTDVSPPSVELKIAMTADGQRVLVAPPMKFNGVDDESLIHVVNLFLEVVGYCKILTADLGEVIQAPLRRLNWKLLPTGKRSWKQLRPDVAEVIKRAPNGNQPVIEHRMETINSYGPDFVAIGLAGFAGYVVFGFTERKLFVLESIYTGNATYVFGDQWENLSKLTKMQVLDNNLHLDRIIHRDGWDRRIRNLLRVDPVRPR